MKILSKAAEYFGTTLGVIVVTGCLYGVYEGIGASREQTSSIQKEMYAKDPERYYKTLEHNKAIGMPHHPFAWNKAYDRMQDSLKMDSIIKKAYFEGAQMVRDSIKNANTK